MISTLLLVALLAADEQSAAPSEQPPTDVPVANPPMPSVEPVPPAGEKPKTEAEGLAPSQFVKGELSVYLGSDRLVVKHTRVGVSAGVDRFGPTYYLLIEPMLDLRFLEGKFGIGIGVPLRLELINLGNDPTTGMTFLTSRLGRVRLEDWDSFHDFGRILKYVTFGRKEDNLYISAGQRYASSIGHGALVRRYAPNIDIDYPRASAQVDYYNDFFGFEFMTNDLLEWNTLSALAFVKPLAFLKSENLLAKTFSVGVTGAVDWNAPMSLTKDALGVRQVDRTIPRLLASRRPVGLIGFDAEVKVVKTEHIDIKPYADYSMLITGNGGFTAGVLGRFNVGKSIINAFRLVAEFRVLGDKYVPSYFDTFYEVERFIAGEFARTNPDRANFATKQELVLAGLGNRAGYYFEASWGIPKAVGVTFALEGVSNSPAMNFVAHLEVPVLDFLQVFGSYYKRGMTSFATLFSLDNTVAYAGLRLRVLPFLFINGRVYKTFRVNPELERYDNQFGFVADLEIGYEFRPKKPEDKPAEPPPPAAMSDVRERGLGSARF